MRVRYTVDRVVVQGRAESLDEEGCPFSAVQQSAVFGRFKPSLYAPRRLLADVGSEEEKVAYPAAQSLVEGVCIGDRVVTFSAVGKDAASVQTLELNLDTEKQSMDLPRYSVTPQKGPVRQIYCNWKLGPGRKSGEMPVIAVRRMKHVDFYRLSDCRDVASMHVFPVLSDLHCTYEHVDFIEDFSWNPYLSDRGVVLSRNGTLSQANCTRGKTHPSTLWNIKNSGATATSPISGIMKCNHVSTNDQQVMVAWQNSVSLVDFREKPVKPHCFYSLQQGDWISAFCTSQSCSTPEMYLYALSTTREVQLFDLRRPESPVVTWEHGMSMPSRRTISWEKIAHSPLNHLGFVHLKNGNEGKHALFGVNTHRGIGVMLDWTREKSRPTMQYFNGRLQIKTGDDMTPLSSFLDKRFPMNFSWKSSFADSWEAVNPPHLVYNSYYPRQMTTIIDQQREDRRSALQLFDTETDEKMRILPSKRDEHFRCRGVCIIDRDWADNSILSDPVTIHLDPAQKIVLGRIQIADDTVDDIFPPWTDDSSEVQVCRAMTWSSEGEQVEHGRKEPLYSELEGAEYHHDINMNANSVKLSEGNFLDMILLFLFASIKWIL